MPQEKAQPTWLKQLVAVEALFLCCVLPWLLSDLWYDEVLSLNVVLLHDSPWEIFRDYRFANNHFLNNFLEWLWLRGLGLNAANEFLVRLPAVFFGMGTVAVVLLGWRKFLGEKIALLTAVVMACSPVFTAFAWQFRGYSLAMFLSALAIHACAIRCQKNTVANGVALFLLGLLLPLVMPPAAMLPCALAVALCAEKGMALRSWMGLWDGVRAAWPPVAGAVLGVAYYLTLWEEFSAATRESGGWTSAWLVGLHVVFAFALHLGVLCVPILKPTQKSAGTESRLGWMLLGGCALALVAVLLVPSPVHRAPFPRVFLVLLPAVTFGVALQAREWSWLNDLNSQEFIGIVVVLALMVRVGSGILTDWDMDKASSPPQNLLQQYYRGNAGVSALLREYKLMPESKLKHQLVLVVPHDVPTAYHYWLLYGLPNNDLGMQYLLPVNQVTSQTLEQYRSRGFDFFLLARHKHEALEWAQTAGFPKAQVEPEGKWHDHHRLFRIVH